MNSFDTLRPIEVGGKTYNYHSLPELQKKTKRDLAKMPYSLKILLENLLRHEDGEAVDKASIEALLAQDPKQESDVEIQFTPGRVLLQDFTGVPVVADLAALRGAMDQRKGDANKVNPLQPVDLVIDHSVQIDAWGTKDAVAKNLDIEFERNGERYQFLKWGQKAFRNFQVVPPGTGICHQVNLEFLARVVMDGQRSGKDFLYPDTLVGTDSHTTMVNGLGVLGWGVGGIEAEAAMLGQPCTMLIPQVVGFKITGQLPAGATATDLVLKVTQMLRAKGVVGKFVEFFGEGLVNLSVADRATIANMAPEYGATCGIFPPDEKTMDYMRLTGRGALAERAEKYLKEQNLWQQSKRADVQFSDELTLDLKDVEPAMAGPAKPHDRVPLKSVRHSFRRFMIDRYHASLKEYDKEKLQAWIEMSDSMKSISYETTSFHPDQHLGPLGAMVPIKTDTASYNLVHGSIVIASITSCTNTSNPSLMIGAGLLARNAVKRGLKRRPWVKTSFAPGSQVVQDYIRSAGLEESLQALDFHFVGFGCTTCIGNSGPLPPEIQSAIEKGGLATASVLSGNRNFEARIHPFVMANYLASPPLVVAAALAGNVNINLATEPLGTDQDGKPVFLHEIWPDPKEVADLVAKHVTAKKFESIYADVFKGDQHWQKIPVAAETSYTFSDKSTYIKEPPFVDPALAAQSKDKEIKGARLLAVFGDSITTDHISPAGNIGKSTPAGEYLLKHGVPVEDFNSYGSRRGNHEVMIRGTFANVRLKNTLAEKEGGFTKIFPEGKPATIFDASETYAQRKIPLVVFAGKEYGTGSSRDWAAKGTRLLGVRAVIAESFERIHRSNLIGMGVLPLQLPAGTTAASLGLDGSEEVDLSGLDQLKPKSDFSVKIRSAKGEKDLKVRVRIDTPNELAYFRAGGILPYVLDRIARA